MYIRGYHSALKKNEMLSFAAAWIELESITQVKSDRER